MTESHEHESIQFMPSKELQTHVRTIFYDTDDSTLNIYTQEKPKDAIVSKVDTSSMRATLEEFDKMVDGALDPRAKSLCVYCIKFHLRDKHVKFDDTEQEWYHENYPNDPGLDPYKKEEKEKKKTNAEIILDTATANIKKLFVDEYQEPHAAILVNDHIETISVKGKRFRNYLANLVYNACHIIVNSATIDEIVNILSAKAEFDKDSETIKLNLRVAESNDANDSNDSNLHQDTKWYYDLTNKEWEFVEITSKGWKIVNNLILFHRYPAQLPQVQPSRNYPSDIFNQFIELVLNKTNVDTTVSDEKLKEYQILAKCYIICAFIPGFPKAIPIPNGTQGAAKSTLMEWKKMIIDPSTARTLSFPRDVDQLIQQLSHNHVIYYDNISGMKDWISDELCRAVSGSGSSKRVLYSDDDDFIRSFIRCIGFNGINIAATKADLLDRAIFFKLKRIKEEDRRYIVELEKQFEAMRPQIFGYILDILVKVLKWKEDNELNLSKIPRMADWAGHCEIIARCMGYEPQEFLNAYRENAKIQTEEIMATSLLATCIGNFVDTDERFKKEVKDLEGKPSWQWIGTSTELKAELEVIAQILKIDIKSKQWPSTAPWLTKRLNEIIHTLSDAGIEIQYDRGNGSTRKIMIRKLLSLPSLPSLTQNHEGKGPKINDSNNDSKSVDSKLLSLNSRSNDSNDSNDGNLHTLPQKQPQLTCSKCGEKGDSNWMRVHRGNCEGTN